MFQHNMPDVVLITMQKYEKYNILYVKIVSITGNETIFA